MLNACKNISEKVKREWRAWPKKRRFPTLCGCFFLILYLLMLPFLGGLLPIVTFPEEQIDIFVYSDYIMVKGYYTYENPHPFPVMQGFAIPLPVDADHSAPVMITARLLSPVEREIPVIYIFNQYRFDLVFFPHERVDVLVTYYQHTPRMDARYILITTQSWRRPLTKGYYRLFPEGVEIVGSNYPLRMNEPGVLSFSEEMFMPEEDWTFSWRTKE